MTAESTVQTNASSQHCGANFSRGSDWRGLLSLWVIAFLIRLAGVALDLLSVPNLLVAADTQGAYYPIARSLAAGEGYQLHGSFLEASRIAPVLPLWLAALMKVTGPDPPLWLVGAGNAAFRAFGVVLLYLITGRFFGPRAATCAATLYLLDPWETLWVGFVIKESLAVPLFLLAIWALCRLADGLSVTAAWGTGLAIGLATLARFPSLVLWPVAGIVVLRSCRKGSSGGKPTLARTAWLYGQLTLATGLALLPWLIRNWEVTGQPVLSPHFAGRKFYTSNGPGVETPADGYNAPAGIDQRLLAKLDQKARPWQREGALFTHTLRHILANPGEFAQRLIGKLVNMWQPTFASASLRNWLVLGVPYCVLLALSLAGVALVLYRRTPCLALAAPLVAMVLVHLVFWGEIRNRQYLMPLLYAFGGLAMTCLARRCGIYGERLATMQQGSEA